MQTNISEKQVSGNKYVFSRPRLKISCKKAFGGKVLAEAKN